MQLQERRFPLHVRVSSLSGKDIELANKAVKRSLSGDSKPVTVTSRQYNTSLDTPEGHEFSMPLTTERKRPLHSFRSFWIVRLASPTPPFSISVTKNFTYMISSVARCSPANIKLILRKIIDYVIAFAVHNRQI